MAIQNIQTSSVAPNFGARGKRKNVDELINTPDEKIRRIALDSALKKAEPDFKKQRAMLAAIPGAAFLSKFVLSGGKSSILGKEVSGLAGRLTAGAKGAGTWMFFIGAASAILNAEKAITNKSEKAKKFVENHDILTWIGNFAIISAMMSGARIGAYKLISKINPANLLKAQNKLDVAENFVNKLKMPKMLKNIGEKISEKTPDLAKFVGALALDFAPITLALTSVFSANRTAARVNNDAIKNYIGLKDTQYKIAQARVNELKNN